jgi:hypothetical protein
MKDVITFAILSGPVLFICCHHGATDGKSRMHYIGVTEKGQPEPFETEAWKKTFGTSRCAWSYRKEGNRIFVEPSVLIRWGGDAENLTFHNEGTWDCEFLECAMEFAPGALMNRIYKHSSAERVQLLAEWVAQRKSSTPPS